MFVDRKIAQQLAFEIMGKVSSACSEIQAQPMGDGPVGALIFDMIPMTERDIFGNIIGKRDILPLLTSDKGFHAVFRGRHEITAIYRVGSIDMPVSFKEHIE